MKLYATVTSERASKGQGGEYLDIEILGHNKLAIARIKVTSTYPYEYNVDVFPVYYDREAPVKGYNVLNLDVKGMGYKLKRELPKGNNQKGERDIWACTCSPKCEGVCKENIPY